MAKIEIIGILGSGKSSVCQHIADIKGWTCYLEHFESCEELEKMYRQKAENWKTGKKRNDYLYAVQKWFMEQIKKDDNKISMDLSQPKMNVPCFGSYVRDGNLVQALAYMQTALINNEISQEEFIEYNKLFRTCFKFSVTNGFSPKVVMLDVKPEIVLQRIKNRGREMESDITLDYLNKLRLSMYQIATLKNYHILELKDEPINIVAEKVLKAGHEVNYG